jgi:hypothetical protein
MFCPIQQLKLCGKNFVKGQIMALWKDASGNRYDDDNGKALSLPSWPAGLTQLTAAEITAFQAAQTPTLAQAQAAACAAIDQQAGITRLKYITDVPGQAETYTAKNADAAAYKAAGYPSASIANYPWVQAEAIAINGATPTTAQIQAAADGIIATAAAWVAKGASIEQARRAGKVAVGATSTVAAAQSAQAAAIAALQAL